MSGVIIGIGILIAFVGGIFFLIETFRESVIWGLACIFVSPVALIFAILHWDVSKRPVIIQLAGLGLVFIGTLTGGNV